MTDRATAQLVAFCGTRGIPANYGGFETAVEEITRRLTEKGIECEVFCRRSSAQQVAERDGDRRLAYVNGSSVRTCDTLMSSLQTGIILLKNRKQYRYVFWFNNANLPGILLTRLAGIPMAVNTDGLEWRRAKWTRPFKAYYLASSALVGFLSQSLISDSRAIERFYRTRFFRRSTFVPYGTPPSRHVSDERARQILRKYGVESGRYFLQITRFEPDNLPLEIANAFVASKLQRDGFSLLSVGYKDATPYALRLKAHHGHGGVSVCDAVYDPDVLHVLRSACHCYLHGNSVGGTNPALLEAMAVAPRVAAIDGEFSREVLADSGWFFTLDTAPAVLRELSTLPERANATQRRVALRYQWDAVADCYASLVDGKEPAYDSALRIPQDEALHS
jgi:glycosyltransferase involved in cell wall biosynthesis